MYRHIQRILLVCMVSGAQALALSPCTTSPFEDKTHFSFGISLDSKERTRALTVQATEGSPTAAFILKCGTGRNPSKGRLRLLGTDESLYPNCTLSHEDYDVPLSMGFVPVRLTQNNDVSFYIWQRGAVALGRHAKPTRYQVFADDADKTLIAMVPEYAVDPDTLLVTDPLDKTLARAQRTRFENAEGQENIEWRIDTVDGFNPEIVFYLLALHNKDLMRCPKEPLSSAELGGLLVAGLVVPCIAGVGVVTSVVVVAGIFAAALKGQRQTAVMTSTPS